MDTIAIADQGGTMNYEAILAALSASEAESKSLKEIAQAMDLDISSYVD